MKTYDFEKSNPTLYPENDKNRRYSKNILILNVVLFVVIVGGAIAVAVHFIKLLNKAYNVGDKTIQDARNPSASNDQIGHGQ